MSAFFVRTSGVCALAAALATPLATLLLAPPALAHITLETRQATPGTSYKAVLRVPHGCQGSATVKIQVRIPEGVVAVKPQPKPGWTLTTVTGAYAGTHTAHGAQLDSGVQEIIWSGGPLQNDHYDEFVFVGFLSNALVPSHTLHFPVIQECEQGLARWVDLPAAHQHGHGQGHGHGGHSAAFPAPALELLPRSK